MNDPADFVDWPEEAKKKFADQKMEEMKVKNQQVLRRYAEVQHDRMAAECKNSSVTNVFKEQKEIARAEKSGVIKPMPERASRDTTRHIREWDRDKIDQDAHRYNRFHNESSQQDRRYYRNDNQSRYHDRRNDRERNFDRRHDRDYEYRQNRDRNDEFRYKDKKSKSYMSHFHNNSKHARDLQHQEHYSKHQSHRAYDPQSHDKAKKTLFLSTSRGHGTKHSGSTSAESELEDIKMNELEISNNKDTTLWPSERMTEDQRKFQQTKMWLQSVPIASVEQDICSEEDTKNISPKRKLDRFETVSDKCLNNNNPHPRQICNLKSRKMDYFESKSSSANEIQKHSEQKKNSNRRSYSKFDRFDHSDKSSEHSGSDEMRDPIAKPKSEEKIDLWPENYDLLEKEKYDLWPENYDLLEKEKNIPQKIKSKCNLKSSTVCDEENQDKRELSNDDRKGVESNSGNKSSYNTVKRVSDKKGFNPSRKFPSYNAGHCNPKESTYNNRGYQHDKASEKFPVKGSKTKRDPQYSPSDTSKNEHFSKQRRFDRKPSKSDFQHSPHDRNYNKKPYNKKSDSAVESVNKDSAVGWADTPDGWGDQVQSYQDDGGWATTEQSGCSQKSTPEFDKKVKKDKTKSKDNDGHRGKVYKVKDPSQSDDGGWSTEEGEIRSDEESGK